MKNNLIVKNIFILNILFFYNFFYSGINVDMNNINKVIKKNDGIFNRSIKVFFKALGFTYMKNNKQFKILDQGLSVKNVQEKLSTIFKRDDNAKANTVKFISFALTIFFIKFLELKNKNSKYNFLEEASSVGGLINKVNLINNNMFKTILNQYNLVVSTYLNIIKLFESNNLFIKKFENFIKQYMNNVEKAFIEAFEYNELKNKSDLFLMEIVYRSILSKYKLEEFDKIDLYQPIKSFIDFATYFLDSKNIISGLKFDNLKDLNLILSIGEYLLSTFKYIKNVFPLILKIFKSKNEKLMERVFDLILDAENFQIKYLDSKFEILIKNINNEIKILLLKEYDDSFKSLKPKL